MHKNCIGFIQLISFSQNIIAEFLLRSSVLWYCKVNLIQNKTNKKIIIRKQAASQNRLFPFLYTKIHKKNSFSPYYPLSSQKALISPILFRKNVQMRKTHVKQGNSCERNAR